MLDFATGSGGFLVESARRIADEAIGGDAQMIEEGLEAIVRGLHGCEISPFPYYLTEVNLLLGVSRLLGRLRQLGASAPRFVLSVIHADPLSARAGRDESLAGLPAEAQPIWPSSSETSASATKRRPVNRSEPPTIIHGAS